MEDWRVGSVGGWQGKLSAAHQARVLRVVAGPGPLRGELIQQMHLLDVTGVAVDTVGSALEAGSPEKVAQLKGVLALMDRVVERAGIPPPWMPEHMQLDAVHQKVRVSREALHVEETPEARRRPRGEEQFSQVEDLAELISPQSGGRGGGVTAVAVIGDGGSGKSWALARAAAEAAERICEQLSRGVPLEEIVIPLWVPLATAGERLAAGLDAALAMAEAAVDHAYPDPGDPPGLWRNAVVRLLAERVRLLRGVLILADGLEEVTTGSDSVVKALGIFGSRAQLRARAGRQSCPLVLSSRPGAYPDLPGFTRAELVAFGTDEQHAFVQAWFGSDNDLVGEVERRLAEPDLRDAASVPLLLALLCLVFNPAEPQAAPATRSGLLAAALDHLLTQPNRATALPTTRRRREDKTRLLGHLAWAYAQSGWPVWLSGHKLRTVLEDHPDLVAHLQRSPRRPHRNHRPVPRPRPRRPLARTLSTLSTAILEDLEDRDGVLVRQGHDSYRWVHPLLGEYLVARHLADPKDDPDLDVDQVLDALRPNLHDPKWRNTVAMVVGCWANSTINGEPERREGAASQPARFLSRLLGTTPDAFHHRRFHVGRALAEITVTQINPLGLDDVQDRLLTELAVVSCSESRHDAANAIEILTNLGPRGLVGLTLTAHPDNPNLGQIIAGLAAIHNADAIAILSGLACDVETQPGSVHDIIRTLARNTNKDAQRAAHYIAQEVAKRPTFNGRFINSLYELEAQGSSEVPPRVADQSTRRSKNALHVPQEESPAQRLRQAYSRSQASTTPPWMLFEALEAFVELAPTRTPRVLVNRVAETSLSHPDLVGWAISLLAKVAPDEALRLAQHIAAGSLTDPVVLVPALRVLHQQAPIEALRLARRAADSLTDSDVLTQVLEVLTQHAPTEALRLARRLGQDTAIHDLNLKRVLEVLTAEDPVEAWGTVVARVATGDHYAYGALPPEFSLYLTDHEDVESEVGKVSDGLAAVGSISLLAPRLAPVLVRWLRSAVAHFGVSWWWRLRLSWALSRWPGREEEAVELLDEPPHNADAWHCVGVLNHRFGNYQFAIECLKRSARMTRSNSRSQYVMLDLATVQLNGWDGDPTVLAECHVLLAEVASSGRQHPFASLVHERSLPQGWATVTLALLRGDFEVATGWARRAAQEGPNVHYGLDLGYGFGPLASLAIALQASPNFGPSGLMLALCLIALASRTSDREERFAHLEEARQALEEGIASSRDLWQLSIARHRFMQLAVVHPEIDAEDVITRLNEAYQNAKKGWPPTD